MNTSGDVLRKRTNTANCSFHKEKKEKRSFRNSITYDITVFYCKIF